MLAAYVEWQMKQSLIPLLFTGKQRETLGECMAGRLTARENLRMKKVCVNVSVNKGEDVVTPSWDCSVADKKGQLAH
jgi:hypothetical protein